jgi:hypothetical protein
MSLARRIIDIGVGERKYKIPLLGREQGFHRARLMKTVPAQFLEGDGRRNEATAKMEKRDQKLQSEVAKAVADFNPSTDNPETFDYLPVGEVLRHSTVDEMAAMFNYGPAQKAIVDTILLEQVTKPFIDRIKNHSTKEQAKIARAFHVSYVAGQIERALSRDIQSKKQSVVLKVERARLQHVVDVIMQANEGSSPEEVTKDKLKFLEQALRTLHPNDEDGVDAAMAIVNKDSWLLDDFNEEDELAVDMNSAGMLATNAVVEFAQQMYLDKSKKEVLAALEDLLHAPDAQLQAIALGSDPQRKDGNVDAQIILFAVRAANYSWIFSKIPQGFTEQKTMSAEALAKKRGKGAGRYTRGEAENKYFTTFDNMSNDKGWPAVLLDMDQIRTGIRILRQSYNSDSKQ